VKHWESVLTSVGVFADRAHGAGLNLFALHWAREFHVICARHGVYVQMGVCVIRRAVDASSHLIALSATPILIRVGIDKLLLGGY
jgi:hypothetical protein